MEIEELQRQNLKELEKRVLGDYEKIVSCANKILLVKRNPLEYQYFGKGWESQILSEAYAFSYGYGRARETERSGYVFYDRRGHKSPEFYYAEDYHGKVAVVQLEKGGAYYFMNERGKLSEPFEIIKSYSDGQYVVKCYNEDVYRFANCDGEVDRDCFSQASTYENGFAKVCLRGSIDSFTRDMMGRLSIEATPSGGDFFLFVNGVIGIGDLRDSYFDDEVFARSVIDFAKRKAMVLYKEAIHDEDKKQALCECRDIYAYTLQRAPYLGFCDFMVDQRNN